MNSNVQLSNMAGDFNDLNAEERSALAEFLAARKALHETSERKRRAEREAETMSHELVKHRERYNKAQAAMQKLTEAVVEK